MTAIIDGMPYGTAIKNLPKTTVRKGIVSGRRVRGEGIRGRCALYVATGRKYSAGDGWDVPQSDLFYFLAPRAYNRSDCLKTARHYSKRSATTLNYGDEEVVSTTYFTDF